MVLDSDLKHSLDHLRMNQYDSSTEVCVCVLFLFKLAVTLVTKIIIIIAN